MCLSVMTPACLLLAFLCFKESVPHCTAEGDEGASVARTRNLLDLAQGLKSIAGGDYEDDNNYHKEVHNKIKELKCQKDSQCNSFSKDYRESVATVKDLLVNIPALNGEKMENTYANFEKLTALLTTMVHKSVMMDALAVAVLTRPDTKDQKPLAALDTKQGSIVPGAGTRESASKNNKIIRTLDEDVRVDYRTNSPVNGREQLVDFFREDILLHVFHDMWHAISQFAYPTDRWGERFAYTHQHFLNRYELERYFVGLPPVFPLNFPARQQPFDSEYRADLRYLGYSGPTAYRNGINNCRLPQGKNAQLQSFRDDVFRTHSMAPFSVFAERLMFVYHDEGHNAIGDFCGDPRQPGNGSLPMVDSAAAARMPIFYRWHAEVESCFIEYKRPYRYTVRDLAPARGVRVLAMHVESKCSDQTVQTFMEEYTLQTLKNRITYRRLNHEDFHIPIRLEVEGPPRVVIMRVFLLLSAFQAERRWYLELDRRTVRLTGARNQVIDWYSENNYLTMKDQAQMAVGAENNTAYGWPCGWPHHLYLPKGRTNRKERFKILVFFHDPTRGTVSEGSGSPFTPHILCGSNARDSPREHDGRSMGFPLDLEWYGVDFMETINNWNRMFGMVATEFFLTHSEKRRMQCTSMWQRIRNMGHEDYTDSKGAKSSSIRPDDNRSDNNAASGIRSGAALMGKKGSQPNEKSKTDSLKVVDTAGKSFLIKIS